MSMTSGLGYGLVMNPTSTHPCDIAYKEKNVATRAQLLNSTSLADFCVRLARCPLAFEPGSRWQYGWSVDVLGRVIEVVSEKRLDDFLREEVLRPLQMYDTDFVIPESKHDRLMEEYELSAMGETVVTDYGLPLTECNVPSGGFGLSSTVDDYLKLLVMLMNDGKLGNSSVYLLAPETARLFNSLEVENLGESSGVLSSSMCTAARFYGQGFGFGCSVVRDPILAEQPHASIGQFQWHGLSGCCYFVDKKKGFAGVFMTHCVLAPRYSHRYQLEKLTSSIAMNLK
jgi:CubicO group peptidase (beta-lactamase class C family)